MLENNSAIRCRADSYDDSEAGCLAGRDKTTVFYKKSFSQEILHENFHFSLTL
jgi:hypothetical protein